MENFTVVVDDIGAFTFCRRTMRLEMKIGAEFSRLTEGIESPSPWFALTANIIAVLLSLTVSAPDGWDIMGMDPVDNDTYQKLVKVHNALRDKEEDFRRAKKSKVETSRADTVSVN